MNIKTIYFFLAATLILIACGKSQPKEISETTQQKTELELKDGMLYGLACEGCNDTFVIMIPTSDLHGKPLKLNVLKAMKQKKVIGKLEAGDWCAVKLNDQDKNIADMVINMDLLKGKWVHHVMPIEKENARTMILLEDPDANVDSIIDSYMIPVERGFQLMRQGKAATIGAEFIGTISAEDNSKPVTYPASSQYASWKVADGQIIFSEADSLTDPHNPDKKIANTTCVRDTCDLLLLLKDSLQISYKGVVSNYYRAQ